MSKEWYVECFSYHYVLCAFCSHQLAVVGKLSLLVTDDNAVDTLLVYCMKQMSNFLTSACNTDYNEELLLTTMLSMLKVKSKVIYVWLMYIHTCVRTHTCTDTITLLFLFDLSEQWDGEIIMCVIMHDNVNGKAKPQ